MKPGKYDIKHNILITGTELRELKRFTYMMVESFGLDRRIDNYKGTRSMGLYRWDLECLLCVIEDALNDRNEYPFVESPEYLALRNLYNRIKNRYESHYDNE